MERVTIETISAVLQHGPHTVAEIAEALNAYTHHGEVHPLVHADVDTMLRHGIAQVVAGVGDHRLLVLP